MPLTDRQIKALQPEIKAKKYFDGEGLYLEVAPSGGKVVETQIQGEWR